MVALRYVKSMGADPYRCAGLEPVHVGDVVEVPADVAERILGDFPGSFQTAADAGSSPLSAETSGLETLPARLQAVLKGAGHTSASLASADDADLLAIKGIGAKALSQIRALEA